MNYKKILSTLVLGLVMALVVGGTAYAVTTVVGTLQFTGGVAGATEKIDFDSGASEIYDDWNLHIVTDDNLYLDVPGITVISNDVTVAGDLGVTGTITGTSVTTGTTATTFTFGSGSDADTTDMVLNLGGTDPAILTWASGTQTLGFSDNFAVTGTTALTGLLTVNAAIGIDITSPITGITAGATTTINWTGTSEWMRVFLSNLDSTPGSSAAVISLTNAGAITSGDQITLELKNDVRTGTTVAPDYLTTLRLKTSFRGSTVYSSGHVQPLYAELSSGATDTLTGNDLRVGYFYTRLQADPGHAEILRLENNCSDQAYIDTHITFIGADSGSAMTFGPTNGTSWNSGTAGETGTKAGWIKVVVAGATRYIRLYDANN